MESMRTFETKILDEDELLEAQEKRLSKPIDAFDIGSIERKVSDLELIRGKYATSPTEQLQRHLLVDEGIVERAVDKSINFFLNAHQQKGIVRSFPLFRIMYQSSEPCFAEIRELVEKDEQDLTKSEAFQSRVLDLLQNKSIPQESWLKTLHAYREYLEAIDKNLQEILPNIKKMVVASFIKNINPELEHPKTEQELMSVFDRIRFRVSDPLARSPEGDHTASNNVISLNPITIEEMFEGGAKLAEGLHLVIHETLHAFSSGQVVRHEAVYRYEVGPNFAFSNIGSQWGGLEITGFDTSRFTWLNEAMTEVLSTRMVSYESTSYKNEQELLQLLLTKGKRRIDERLLINAYFERRGYQAKEQDGQKFWNQLRKEIREAYPHDPQFLIKLDILVQKSGTVEALKILREWDTENPFKIDIRTLEGK